jgi:vitamin B12 transporter
MTRIAGFHLNAGARIESNERFGSFVTGRASVARAVRDGTLLRGAIGTGLKEPTFFETFAAGFAVGNPDLDPERSRSWEFGVNQRMGSRASLDLAWFDQSFKDLIQYTSAPQDPGGVNYFNIAEATARGLEVEARAALEGVSLVLGWTWLDTEVTDAGFQSGGSATFVEGQALLRRPEHTVTIRGSGQLSGSIGWSAGARRVGARSDRDFSSFPAKAVELASHTVLDLGLDATLVESVGGRPGFGLSLRFENLENARFEEAVGFGAPRRGVYLGGRLDWSSR